MSRRNLRLPRGTAGASARFARQRKRASFGRVARVGCDANGIEREHMVVGLNFGGTAGRSGNRYAFKTHFIRT